MRVIENFTKLKTGEENMKPLMVFGIILASIFAIVLVLLLASMINHKTQLQIEAKEYLPPGSMIEVNN